MQTNFSHISPVYISKSKNCFNVKCSTYYFHLKTKILADFQICISAPLTVPRRINSRDLISKRFCCYWIHWAIHQDNFKHNNKNARLICWIFTEHLTSEHWKSTDFHLDFELWAQLYFMSFGSMPFSYLEWLDLDEILTLFL